MQMWNHEDQPLKPLPAQLLAEALAGEGHLFVHREAAPQWAAR
jgi:hypothetical protein